jgi:hypothetical protein
LPDAHRKLTARALQDLGWHVHPRAALGQEEGVITINVAGNLASSSILSMLESHTRTAPDTHYIAKAEARLLRFDEAKADIETRRAAPADDETRRRATTDDRRQPERAAPAGDPVDAYIARCPPATAEWFRAHRDDARAVAMSVMGGASDAETRRASKLNAAHNDAIAEGLRPESESYFRHVETFIAPRQQQRTETRANAGNGQAQPNVKPRRPAVPVAPVNGSPGGTNGGGPEVRLSRGEVESATGGALVWNYDDPTGQKRFKKGDPIGVQEFARRKYEMKRQGLYDKSYTE